MQDLLYADAFFFISAVGFIGLFIVLMTILVYVLFIVRDMKKITKAMRREGEAFIHELGSLRGAFTSGAAKAISAIISSFLKTDEKPKRRPASTKKKKGERKLTIGSSEQ